MTSLPPEIVIYEIFPNLPEKSLARFRCVSKSFNNAKRLLILSNENNTNIYSFDIDSSEPATATKIPFPKTIDQTFLLETVFIVGSFSGLLCVGCAMHQYVEEFIHLILNPGTSEFREIPYVSTPVTNYDYRVSFGFGFDDINDDYKIVRVFELAYKYDHYSGDELYSREVMVFSLNENKWNLVENVNEPKDSLETYRNASSSKSHNGVLIKSNLLHWLFRDLSTYRIRCLDVRYDKWTNDVPLMDLFTDRMTEFNEEDQDKVVIVENLEVLRGCLCVLTRTNLSQVVWIMKEYGVKESWVKLFEISDSRRSPRLLDFSCPLGFRQGSKHEVLVRKYEGDSFKLVWCDIESGNYGRTEEINGLLDNSEGACFFIGSQVSIPGSAKIDALADRNEMFEDNIDAVADGDEMLENDIDALTDGDENFED